MDSPLCSCRQIHPQGRCCCSAAHPNLTCSLAPRLAVLLRGANDYMLDEMDRSLHDAFCIVKRVLENERVVAGAWARVVLVGAGCCRAVRR